MSNDDNVVLQLERIVKRFGRLEVLRGIDLIVHERDVLVLIGPSGSGKSTCLRCINGLEVPDGGAVYFRGKRINFAERRQRRELRKRIGIVFQSYNLFPHLTVEENITIGPRKVLGIERRAAIQQAHQLLEKFGLLDKAQELPDRLSGGQQQRVAIIRALAMKPQVLLLDEVTSALDPELTREVLDLITQLAAEGMTMVVVSHEIPFVRRIATRIAFLEAGQIVIQGPAQEVLNSHNERVQKFLKALEV